MNLNKGNNNGGDFFLAFLWQVLYHKHVGSKSEKLFETVDGPEEKYNKRPDMKYFCGTIRKE